MQIVEPIPSASLEAIIKGIPTSYKLATAVKFGAMLGEAALQRPDGFPEVAKFSDEFRFRAIAATRTFKSRPQAQIHIPLGTSYTRISPQREVT